jgi:hypothetical protein
MFSKLLSLCLTSVASVIQSPSFIGYFFPETILVRGIVEVSGISNRSDLFPITKHIELLVLTTRWLYSNSYLLSFRLGVGSDLVAL